MENSMEVPQKTKNRVAIWSSNPTSVHIPDKTVIWKDTCTPTVVAALFTIAKTWEQPKCPSAGEWKMLVYLLVSSMCLAHKKHQSGLPWWLSGKEFACQCRRHGLDPWTRKIPHAAKRLGLCTPTVKSVSYKPHYATKATAMESLCATVKSSPCSLRLEKAHTATKTQCSQK